MRLVRQILTPVREDTDNVTLTPPIASSSRLETAEKINLTTSEEEPSTVTPINLQASKSCCGQIRQALSCFTKTIPNDIHERTTELSSLSKEKSATVTFDDSQISSPRSQMSSHARTSSDNIQRKVAKEPILMTESSMPSDSKTEISKESNNDSTTPVNSPSSSTVVSADTTIVTKTKSNTKVTKKVVYM